MWERACSRKRSVSQHRYWMCRRFREQARSHTKPHSLSYNALTSRISTSKFKVLPASG
ncbi:hypothetical protein SAMN03159391_04158 [Pseudomonas sp. NFACC37-1]|nr:hypothetical protein SAMN03159391_04158 [Pseudomonas sp. NFACC37-1]SFO58963.1 hypothetical protein SAMN03159304_04060 [Pseudomonas sp. NFACC24-1]